MMQTPSRSPPSPPTARSWSIMPPRRPHDGRNRQEIGARLLWRVTITRLFRRLFHGGSPRLDRGARVQRMDSLAGPRKRPPGISALRRKFLSVHGLPETDPKYDLARFDFDKDPARMVWIRQVLDATDPHLSRYQNHGGKIVMYFGWPTQG